MSAVVAVGKGEVHALIEAHAHSAAHKGDNSLPVVVYGVADILYLSAVEKIPEALFLVLFLNGGDILGNMAVEAVADIFSVGNIFDDAVYLAELLYLQATEVLSGGAVDCVEVLVLLLEIENALVDVFHDLQREFSALCDAFACCDLLQLVERGYSEGSGRVFQQRLYLVVDTEVSSEETTLAVRKGIRACLELPEISISALVEPSDKVEVVVKHLVEILALLLRLCVYHGKMQRDRTDIESAYKNRLVVFVEFQEPLNPFEADILLKDNQTVTVGDITFKVIHTPGHTVGGVCYLFDNILISGDTLFDRSIGRTDFPGGDFDVLEKSIKGLYQLKGDTVVLPGHGNSTTIEEEMKFNPFVRG